MHAGSTPCFCFCSEAPPTLALQVWSLSTLQCCSLTLAWRGQLGPVLLQLLLPAARELLPARHQSAVLLRTHP